MTWIEPQLPSKSVDARYGTPIRVETYRAKYLPELVHGVDGSVPRKNRRPSLELLEVLSNTWAA